MGFCFSSQINYDFFFTFLGGGGGGGKGWWRGVRRVHTTESLLSPKPRDNFFLLIINLSLSFPDKSL